jgi:hypothetical protein
MHVYTEKDGETYEKDNIYHYLRTNVTLQQFDIFFKTFDIHKGDNMYLDENDRVSVW